MKIIKREIKTTIAILLNKEEIDAIFGEFLAVSDKLGEKIYDPHYSFKKRYPTLEKLWELTTLDTEGVKLAEKQIQIK